MDNKVWCEDCRWVDITSFGYCMCKNKTNRTRIEEGQGPYVVRPWQSVDSYAFCKEFNRYGDCPQYEAKKSTLVQIRDFFYGR